MVHYFGKNAALVGVLLGSGLALGCGETSSDPGDDPGNPFDAVVTLDSSNGTRTVHGLWLDEYESRELCGDCRAEEWAPDHRQVMVSTASTLDRRYLIVSANGEQHEIGSLDLYSWSPDSERLAFARAQQAFIGDAQGRSAMRVASADGTWELSWSPDGQHLAFQTQDAVVVTDVSGAETLRIAGGSSVSWAPDGQRLAVGTSLGVEIVDWDGAEHVMVTTPTTENDPRGWSPDGQFVAFGIPAHVATWLGTVVRSGAAPDYDPIWSPVEAKLGFLSYDELAATDRLQVWSSSSTNTLSEQVASFSWSPRGSLLASNYSPQRRTLIDASDGTVLAELDGAEVTFNPDGSRMLIADSYEAAGVYVADLWTADERGQNRTLVASQALTGHWLDDGEHLVVVTESEVSVVRADGADSKPLLSGSFAGASFPYDPTY